MSNVFDLVLGEGAFFSSIISLIGVLGTLLLAAVVLGGLRNRGTITSKIKEGVTDSSFVGYTGGAYFYMGISMLYLIEGLTGYLFLYESFPVISFCLMIIIIALCIAGQIAGWLEPFSYNKILFSIDAVLGACMWLGLRALGSGLDGIGLLWGVLCFAVSGFLCLFIYFLNKKVAEKATFKKSSTIISKIMESIKYYQSGGKDYRHPLRALLSLMSFCLVFSVLWLTVSYSMPISITFGQSVIEQEDGSKIDQVMISNLAFCPIAYVYYQEGDTDPFAIDSYYYQTLGADIILYQWSNSSPDVGVKKINWTNNGYLITNYREDGTIRYLEEFDRSDEKFRQVDYDEDNEPEYYWKVYRDENGEEQYIRTTPEGVEIT